MKRYLLAIFCCLMIGFFLVACAAPANDRRGYGGKKNIPKPAQEEVVPKGDPTQSK